MSEEKPRLIKKMTLPDGSRVGIANLDIILKEVAGLKLTDTETLKKELIERVKDSNYVALKAEEDYATALLREYEVKLGKAQGTVETHRHKPG
jgi:hypothetical protein